MVATRQRLQCQLPLTVKHTHVYAARRPLAPHQGGRLNNERRIVTEKQAEMMQFPAQVRSCLLLGRIRPKDAC